VLLGALALRWRRRALADRATAPESPPVVPGWYPLTPHLTLVGVYLAVAISENINIGHRHVVPIYPSLYVLAGAAAWALGRRTRWLGTVVVLLVAWRGIESAAIRPHYLAYFAPHVGGAKEGHLHLVDSSLDWGMDLPGLKRWLDRHNPEKREPVFLAYFGTDSPKQHGIDCVRLPGFRPRRAPPRYALKPGYYAISATLLSGTYLPTFGHWNPIYERLYQSHWKNARLFEASARDPAWRAELLERRPEPFWRNGYLSYDHFRFGRLCAWLRQQGNPPYHVGHSIFIWKLGESDLRAALHGPPPELHDPPAEWIRLVGGKRRNQGGASAADEAAVDRR
jgi:hypothetical protein